ncbi:hypothetical protein D3C78_96820 [compost metagenome]
MNNKVICVGGELNGVEVEFVGPKFYPLDASNPIDVFKLPLSEFKEIDNIGPVYGLENIEGPFGQKSRQYKYLGRHPRISSDT